MIRANAAKANGVPIVFDILKIGSIVKNPLIRLRQAENVETFRNL